MLFMRICFVGAMLSTCVGAVVLPEFRSDLVFDDFDNIYGDPVARNYTGALKSYALVHSVIRGDYGYWYVYCSGAGEVQNSVGELITETSITSAFDTSQGVMHVRFTCPDNGDSAAIVSDIIGEYNYADLSRMTALSIKVKGTGKIRVFFKTKKISQEYSTGHLGVEISLVDTFKTFIFPLADLDPPEGSAPELDGITWNNCKKGVTAFGIENFVDIDGTSEPAEVYIDEIRFKGMLYSDILPTAVEPPKMARSTTGVTDDFLKESQSTRPAFNLVGARLKDFDAPGNKGAFTATSSAAGFYLIPASDSHGSGCVPSCKVK